MKKFHADPETVLHLAAEVICDPRTVKRFLNGENVRATTAVRIERALRRLGYAMPKRRAA